MVWIGAFRVRHAHHIQTCGVRLEIHGWKILSGTEGKVILKVEIKGIAELIQLRNVSIVIFEIELQ
jgi:hypothetical protein